MKITNRFGLPKQIVNACLQDDGHEPVEGVYHATELIKPCKMSVLERRHRNETELDANDCVWLVFGKAVHEVLQYGNLSHFMEAEKPIYREIDGVSVGAPLKLKGQLDLWQPRWKKVVDWKTATVAKWLRQDYEDYRRQGLEYAWLLQSQGKQVASMEFVMFLKDWSKGQARLAKLQGKPYPPSAIQTWTHTVTVDEMAWIDGWIKDRVRTIREYEAMKDEEIPDCTSEERWESPTLYAVMKEGRKSAVKLYGTLEEAQEACGDDPKLSVETRPGVRRRCEDYCLAAKWCYLKGKED